MNPREILLTPKRKKEIREFLGEPRVAIIDNTTSGDPRKSDAITRDLGELSRHLSDRDGLGLVVEAPIQTKSARHAQEVVRDRIAKGIIAFIVKGGDGSIAPIAKAIYDANLEAPDKPSAQLITAGEGTQNVLHSVLHPGLNGYGDPMDSILVNLAIGKPINVDLGQLVTNPDSGSDSEMHPVLINASFGLIAKSVLRWDTIDREGKAKQKQKLGSSFFKERKGFEGYNVALTMNSNGKPENFSGVGDLVFVNGGLYGIWPLTRSDMTDGKIEGVIIPRKEFSNRHIGKILSHLRSSEEGPKKIKGYIYPEFNDVHISLTDTQGNIPENVVFQVNGDPKTTTANKFTLSIPGTFPLWVPNAENNPTFAHRGGRL